MCQQLIEDDGLEECLHDQIQSFADISLTLTQVA